MSADRIKSPPNRDRAIAKAQKYVWWKPPAETLCEPVLLVAQMMTMDAVKALGYFDEGAAANVDEATRDVPRHHTGSWDGSVSHISKVSVSLSDD